MWEVGYLSCPQDILKVFAFGHMGFLDINKMPQLVVYVRLDFENDHFIDDNGTLEFCVERTKIYRRGDLSAHID